MKILFTLLTAVFALSYSYAQNTPATGGDATVAAGNALKVFTVNNGVTGVKLFGSGGTWDTNWGPGYLQLYGSYIYDNGSSGLNFANGAKSLYIHTGDANSPVGLLLNAAGSSYFNNAVAVGGNNGPLHKLHVIGDLTMNNSVDAAQFGITGSADNQKRFIFGLDTTGNGFGFIKVGRFNKGWSNLLLQPNGGNIGIGTVSPQSLVEIRKDNRSAQGPVLELTNGGSYENASSEIYFSTYARESGDPSARIKVADNGDWGGNYYFDTKDASTMQLSTKMYIDGYSGNIGIGTVYPDYKLSVAGNFKVSGIGNVNNYFSYSGGADLDMRCADRGTGGRVFVHDFNNICTINYGGDFTGGTKIGSNAFFGEGSLGNSYISGGNVSIGTTDPHGYKLAVNGSAIATSVTVKTYDNWPDFVFKKSYHLLSLNEVKDYIDQNNHLPEIPSAKQIAENGINLGEMNAKLLKKVEELTLYLIEQNKELSKLKLEVSKLKSEK